MQEIARKAFNNGEGVLISSDSYAVIVDENGYGEVLLLDLGLNSHLLPFSGYSYDDQNDAAEKFIGMMNKMLSSVININYLIQHFVR